MSYELTFSFLTITILSVIIVFYSGWRKHMIMLFCLFLYVIYLYITPLYYASENNYMKFYNDFGNYFNQGMWIYVIALLFFILGYFLTYFFNSGSSHTRHISGSWCFNYKRFDILFYLVLLLNLVALSNKGISLNAILYPEQAEIDTGKGGLNTYIMFFSDSLITVLIAAYLFKIEKRKLITWILISFLIFLVLGFRYRILLTVSGILIIYFLRNRVELKRVVFYPLIVVVVSYIVIFITNNRHAFRTINFDDVSFDWKINGEEERLYIEFTKDPLFYSQTNNFSTDFSVLKSFELGYAKHDYGESMFVFTIIRLIPSMMFEDGIKPKTPQLTIIQECFGSEQGYYAGAAVSNIFEYYIAYGELGAYLCMFLFGTVLAIVAKSLKPDNYLSVLLYVILTTICFQLITRGFTPQTTNHLGYMMIPYFAIKWWINKKSYKLDESKQVPED